MSLRVRHVACVAPPSIGGIGVVAWQEVAHLRQAGVAAELIVPQKTVTYPPEVRPWPTVFSWGNGAILKHPRRLFADIDVLHLHYPFFGTAEFLLCLKPPVPVVVTFHMDARATGWKEAIFSAHQQLVQPFLLKRAAKILVSSEDYLAHSSLASFAKKNSERCTTVPFAVDTTRFTPHGARSSLIPEDGRQLTALFVGGLDRAHAFKGIAELLNAVSRVNMLRLIVVGDGDLRTLYEQQAQKLGIEKRVIFLGRVADEELPVIYRSVDVCVLPSTNEAEAFGLVLIEAQACGTPVVASDLPGVRTVLQPNETGLLVQPGSVESLATALQRCVDQPDWRSHAGAAARAWIEKNYTWDVHTRRLLEIYHEVCA